MKRIYLVRHGESQWNVLKKIQGQKDIPLTEKGIEQAKLTGKRLIEENIDVLVSSDLQRAYDTAKIIGEMIRLEPIPMEGLREINFGAWEGLSRDLVDGVHKEEIQLWRKEPEKLRIKNAETLKEVQNRALSSLGTIISSDYKNILVVSHGVTLKTIILGLLGMDLKYFKNLTLNNVALSVIEFRDYNRVLKVLNDTSHLKESL